MFKRTKQKENKKKERKEGKKEGKKPRRHLLMSVTSGSCPETSRVWYSLVSTSFVKDSFGAKWNSTLNPPCAAPR